ncbi:MAG: glutathione S-transferase family protein [Alphaproteobacteria bacterium]
MGKLVDGSWLTDEAVEEQRQYASTGGRFQRTTTDFRHWITSDGAPGPTSEGGFPAEAGRYHLYGALNCPWAHRAMIYRIVKGLTGIIGLSLAKPQRSDQGWIFDSDPTGRFHDPINKIHALHELYTLAAPDYTGRVTVPVLWDCRRNTIVSNESAEIIRMFNSAFNAITGNETDYAPPHLQGEIDTLNERIFRTVNNGVYKTGFARTQSAYDEAVTPLFETLDYLDARLANQRYLLGEQITEADWRLLPTLLRFDAAYYSAFKCNLKRLVDYPNLWPYTRDLYQQPGLKDIVDFNIYRHGYHSKSPVRNPLGIIPVAYEVDFAKPHGRG